MRSSRLLLLGGLVLLIALHLVRHAPTEPFYNNDETRHVMTGVFFRDLLADLPTGLREYTENYYVQYPALGLLIWPPLFYVLEGLTMSCFGVSFIVGQLLIAAFALMAGLYLYLLVARTHSELKAALVVLLCGVMPLVFVYTHQVMLEMPTLAWCLMATYHCARHLEKPGWGHLWLCAGATAAAALTRFDAVFLAPFYLLWLLFARRFDVLRTWRVWFAATAAVLVVVPYYLLASREFGPTHWKAVREGTNPDAPRLSLLSRIGYYPCCVPEQAGWFIVAPALVGLGAACSSSRRSASAPYLAVVVAVYLTFTPLAEREPRHAIYWTPALALFAVEGCWLAGAWFQRQGVTAMLLAGVFAGTTATTIAAPLWYVRGYEEAARYVLEQSTERQRCLFDNFLNGNFIFQVRRHDPGRRMLVLRGDKLFYSVLIDPHGPYEEWVKDEKALLERLHAFDPEYLVVEEPQIYGALPGADRLRQALQNHPELFRREKVVELETNHPSFRGHALHIYRKLLRNPQPRTGVEIRMLGLGRDLEGRQP
jgi:hypothetical protein